MYGMLYGKVSYVAFRLGSEIPVLHGHLCSFTRLSACQGLTLDGESCSHGKELILATVSSTLDSLSHFE